MSYHVAHLSYGNCRVGVNGVMTTWPPRYSQRVNCFGFRAKTGVLTLSSVVKNANVGVCAEEKWAEPHLFSENINDIKSFSEQNLWSFLKAGLTFSTCLH